MEEELEKEEIEQFWTKQFVIVVVVVTELAFPINPPELEEKEEEDIEQFWTEQFVIVVIVAEQEFPINPPE